MIESAEQNVQKKVVLVTGASSGIGWSTAECLVAAGHRVFGTSRAKVPTGPAGVHMLTLDVEDTSSVKACVDTLISDAGRLDVLVSNAGRMLQGLAEEVPSAAARSLFETNFWGTVHVVNAVLPQMRAQRRGHVLIVGSVAAWVALPLNGFYSASKAALARYTESLRHETLHLGLRVVLIEPGDFASALWRNAERFASVSPDYAHLVESALAAVEPALRTAPPAHECAALLARIAQDDDPEPVYRVGRFTRRLPLMRALMPARYFERGLRNRFGLSSLR